jgi:4'-phosphopantetheinyl transferase
MSPTDLVFAKHEYGKPYLLDHALHFNHSHSQQYYALALSERVKDIGIDVEELDRKVRLIVWHNMLFILMNMQRGKV